MSWISRLRGWAARWALKAAQWPITPTWAQYAFMDIAFPTLVRDGYKKNSAVFACAQALAFGFSEARPTVMVEGVEVREHPLSRLLRQPNPDMGAKMLLMYTITYMAIGGNCYWWKIRNAGGQVIELWPLHDGQMWPVAGGTRLIGGYELDTGNGIKPIPTTDVVQFMWAVDPAQPWRGLGALVPAARDVDADNAMTEYTFTLLKNNAVPPLAIVVPPDVLMDAGKVRRMREEWTENYGGTNQGRPAVLTGGMDVKQLSFDINRLAGEALRKIPESRIAACFRVPAIIAGLQTGLDAGTYANYETAMRAFAEYTLLPLWDRCDDLITRVFSDDFDLGDDTQVVFDTAQVTALQGRVAEAFARARDGIAGGFVMVNEGRAWTRQPRVAGGDVFLRGLNVMEIPASVELAKGAFAAKAATTVEARRAALAALAQNLQATRKGLEGRFARDIQKFFEGLAQTVVERAKRQGGASGLWARAAAIGEGKQQLTLPGFVMEGDFTGLLDVFGSWYYTILEESWVTWNTALGVTLTLNQNDPAVVDLVTRFAGERITQVGEATVAGMRDVLSEAYRRGFSIDHIVAGDPDAGLPALADVVGGLTYRGPGGKLITLTPEQRARMVARTELGNAQNEATAWRYEAAGVNRVVVLDDGFDDSHAFCKAINGKVVTLEWARSHPLCHPNCVRAFAPEFDAPLDEGATQNAAAAGTCPFG